MKHQLNRSVRLSCLILNTLLAASAVLPVMAVENTGYISEGDSLSSDVPSDAAIISPEMSGDEIAARLSGSKNVLLQSGSYDRSTRLVFDHVNIYAENGVTLNCAELVDSSLYGAQDGARISFLGSLSIAGGDCRIENVQIVSTAAPSARTADFLKQGRLNWHSRTLEICNARIELANNSRGAGFSCGGQDEQKVSRRLALDNTILTCQKNQAAGLDADTDFSSDKCNLTVDIQNHSRVYLAANASHGFAGSSIGTSLNLENSSLSATSNSACGLASARVQAVNTDGGRYSITASGNGGCGIGSSGASSFRTSLSAKKVSVTVKDNRSTGIKLCAPDQTALDLEDLTLTATGNKGTGLQISQGSVQARNITADLGFNSTQDNNSIKSLFARSAGSIIQADEEILLNTTGYITVTFSANGGTFANNVREISASLQPDEIGGAVVASFPEKNPEWKGRTFEGWNTSPDGKGQAVTDSVSVSKNTMIYAIWSGGNGSELGYKPEGPDPKTGGEWIRNQQGQYLYRNQDGSLVKNTFIQIDDQTFCFNEDGILVTGWRHADEQMRYFDPYTGAMAKGFENIDGKTYYFDNKGVMLTGMQTITDHAYLFDANGVMQTGWALDDGTWFYFHEDGTAATGWIRDGSSWYFLDSRGAMEKGWLDQDGTVYYLDSSGAMKTGWLKLHNNWYYLDRSGKRQTDSWVQDQGQYYYLDQEGLLIQSSFLQEQNSWYYLDSSGAMKTGWLHLDTGWYYFQENGKMAADTAVDGYRFSKDGTCINPES